MKRVRIVNHGGPAHLTEVTDTDNGEKVENIARVDLSIVPVKEPVKAVITVNAPIVDVIADAEIKHICPCCGKPKEE